MCVLGWEKSMYGRGLRSPTTDKYNDLFTQKLHKGAREGAIVNTMTKTDAFTRAAVNTKEPRAQTR